MTNCFSDFCAVITRGMASAPAAVAVVARKRRREIEYEDFMRIMEAGLQKLSRRKCQRGRWYSRTPAIRHSIALRSRKKLTSLCHRSYAEARINYRDHGAGRFVPGG